MGGEGRDGDCCGGLGRGRCGVAPSTGFGGCATRFAGLVLNRRFCIPQESWEFGGDVRWCGGLTQSPGYSHMQWTYSSGLINTRCGGGAETRCTLENIVVRGSNDNLLNPSLSPSIRDAGV